MKYVITDKGTVIRDGEEVKGLESNPVIIPKRSNFKINKAIYPEENGLIFL